MYPLKSRSNHFFLRFKIKTIKQKPLICYRFVRTGIIKSDRQKKNVSKRKVHSAMADEKEKFERKQSFARKSAAKTAVPAHLQISLIEAAGAV